MNNNGMVVHVVGPEDFRGTTVTVYPNGEFKDPVLEFWFNYRDSVPALRYRFLVAADLHEIQEAGALLKSFRRFLDKLPVPPRSPGEFFTCVAAWLKKDRATLYTAANRDAPLKNQGEVHAQRIARLLDEKAAEI